MRSESQANPGHSSSYRRFFNWGLPLIILAKLKEVGTLPSPRTVRSCKYLNNVVEQDHRRIKQRIRADARIQAIQDGGRDYPRH